MKKLVHVAVGVIKREQTIFIAKRHQEQHQGGKWEFPGGKVETGETVTQALARELKEEIGLTVNASIPYLEVKHDYPDKSVLLDIHLVEDFSGEPSHLEGQETRWASINELDGLTFPDANQVIIDKLKQDL